MSGPLDPERIRPMVDLASLVGSTVQLEKRRGDWSMGLCPFHAESNPSFAVRHSRQTFNCFGCGAHGDCFDWVQRIHSMDFRAAVTWLAAQAGAPGTERYRAATAPIRRQPVREPSPAKNEAAARSIWRECRPIAGTQGEAYFRGRGITIPLPSTLRFSRGLKHGPSGLVLPCVVAAVCNFEREVVGIWRIFLDPEEPLKADVQSNKMGLGRASGCAVRLSPLTDTLAVAEGIETALSIAEVRPEWTVWSVLSAGGFRSLLVPPEVKRVAFCRDNDRASADASMSRAMELNEGGIEAVCITPGGRKGYDFNDLLVDSRKRAAEASMPPVRPPRPRGCRLEP